MKPGWRIGHSARDGERTIAWVLGVRHGISVWHGVSRLGNTSLHIRVLSCFFVLPFLFLSLRVSAVDLGGMPAGLAISFPWLLSLSCACDGIQEWEVGGVSGCGGNLSLGTTG